MSDTAYTTSIVLYSVVRTGAHISNWRNSLTYANKNIGNGCLTFTIVKYRATRIGSI